MGKGKARFNSKIGGGGGGRAIAIGVAGRFAGLE